MIGETIQHETEESQQEELQKIIEISREEGKQEALQNLTAEQELSIAQNVIAKSGKKFLGSEGKYPFLSGAVNSDEQKLKRVSNLQQWEIEKIKTYTRLEMFLNKIGMTDFSKTVNSEKEEIMKLSTSKEGYLLQIAGTEAVISKNTQRVEEDRGKK